MFTSRTLFLIVFLSFLSLHARAQTFNATGDAIPDNGTQVAYPVTVSGLSNPAINTTFGLETVCINISHEYVGDLVIKLKAPDGTIVTLALNVGGDGDQFTNTCFTESSATHITSGASPFTGIFVPVGSIGNVNNGQDGNGIWYLLVQDTAPTDTGHVIDFTLTFGNAPATPYVFGSSNLPLVMLNTVGNMIVDEPKVMAKMGIIHNGIGLPNHPTDPYNVYNGWIGIEYRGSSSSFYPQKSYGIETRDTFGNDLTAFILGLPPEEDWALVSTYNDKSLMRNEIAYGLANQMNRYAPRTRFCEVFLDGEYQGVYLLVEKIKRDNNRVNISKLLPTHTSGDELTGGYILKIDKFTGTHNGSWESPYPPADGVPFPIYFQYEYPKAADLQPEQDEYIKGYVDSFESALHGPDFADTNIGYRHFADMHSFIDNFIVNEISRNLDGYRLSYFFYKDKNSKGGKLKSGPAWDYNLAWSNSDYCDASEDTGWAYRIGQVCPEDYFQVPFWWQRMLQDSNYTQALKCRWKDLRSTVLSNQHIFDYIDSNASYLGHAQSRHFSKWPVLGFYTWPNPSPAGQTYADEISGLKAWIGKRMTWLDANMPGICDSSDIPLANHEISEEKSIRLYPNPFTNDIKLEYYTEMADNVKIEVYSSIGQLIHSEIHSATAGINHHNINFSDNLSAGVYLIKLSGKYLSTTQRIIKQAE